VLLKVPCGPLLAEILGCQLFFYSLKLLPASDHIHTHSNFFTMYYMGFFSSLFALKWHVHGIIAILKEELVATNPAAASGATERLIKHTTLVLVGRTPVSVGDEAACLGLARTPVLISASIAWFVPEKLSSWSCVP